MSGKSFAIQCKNCGRWRACLVDDVLKYMFKCFKCGKGFKLKKKGSYGLALKMRGPETGAIVAKEVARLNASGKVI